MHPFNLGIHMVSKNLDGNLIKRAHKQHRWTEQQITELAKCQDPVSGPHYFMNNYFYIQHPTKGKMQYTAYDYQVGLINAYHEHRFSVAMMGRQLGKTTTAAGYLLWYSMFIDDSTILIAAHKYTGAQEIMSRIRYAYETCPDFIRGGVTSYNKQSMEFENGSRIIAQTTTETTGRGLSVSLLYCDELSYVEPNIARGFWTSISPTLATGGKALITSTPNSDEDQFADIWHEANKRFDEFGNEQELGKNGFFPYLATWDQHPDRDQAWANSEMSRIGEEKFKREHNCQFIVYEETLINSITLSDLAGIDPMMKMGQARWYKKINPYNTYIISLDPSLGTGGDYAAIQVLELPTLDQVCEWHHNTTPVQAQIRILRDLCRYIDEHCKTAGVSSSIYYSVENNTVGEAALVAISELGEESIPGMFLSEPIKKGHVKRYRKGFNTTHNVKISSCAKLKQLIESKKLTIFSKSLVSELKTFVAKGVSFGAKSSTNDDLVMSMLLAIRMTMLLQDWDQTIYEKIRETTGEIDEYDLPMPIFISSH